MNGVRRLHLKKIKGRRCHLLLLGKEQKSQTHLTRGEVQGAADEEKKQDRTRNRNVKYQKIKNTKGKLKKAEEKKIENKLIEKGDKNEVNE